MGEEVPTLLDHLHEKYKEQRAYKDDPILKIEDPVERFLAFCTQYLDTHRTVQTWPTDANIGIVLANNTRLLIHPPSNAGMGGMQNSGAVDVTEGQTQPGQEGVIPGDGRKII